MMLLNKHYNDVYVSESYEIMKCDAIEQIDGIGE